MGDDEWMDLAEEAGQLREAMITRAPIEQAKGAIAVLMGTDPDAAFEEIRRVSNNHNVKLRDVCEAFMAVTTGSSAPESRSALAAAMALVVLAERARQLTENRSVEALGPTAQ